MPRSSPLSGRVDVRHNLLVLVRLSGGNPGDRRGLGELSAMGLPGAGRDPPSFARPALLGETLDDPARLHGKLARAMRGLANQMGAIGPFQQALAGADIALWACPCQGAGDGRRCGRVLDDGPVADTIPSMPPTCRSTGRR
jgi:L-alanine-DL-glutamate epimerase-like enolase superfamily enzyme